MRYAPEQIEYAKNRYVNETNRLYQVHKAPHKPDLSLLKQEACCVLRTALPAGA